MENELTLVLEEFGLTKKEAIIYLVSLKLGLARVSEISKESGILRETTYGLINSLVNKGLISSVVKSGVRYFEASEPAELKRILKERTEKINKVLPLLNKIRKSRVEKPSVYLYEGEEGIKIILDSLLESKTEVLTICSNKYIKELFKFYFPNFVKRRINRKIKTKLLTDEIPLTEKMLEYRLLPKGFSFRTGTWIYDNKIALISLSKDEPIGVIVEDKEIMLSQKSQFELIWSLMK